MGVKVSLVTAPSSEPVTLEQVKDHLRIVQGDTLQDDYLKRLIKAARQKIEDMTNRKFVTQTWNLYRDNWPGSDDDYIEIPFAPLQSVASTGVTYTKISGGTTTFSSTAWDDDTVSEPPRVILKTDSSWPTATLAALNPICIRCVVGYTTPSLVPEPLNQAILLLVSHMYEYREPVISGQAGFVVAEVPRSIDALVADYRLFHF
jgi:uncharacterized phiE125 gp8 family phage protein